MIPFNGFYQTPENRSNFDRGYEACYEDLSDMVKKLGKKYYKEFLLGIKKNNQRLFYSYTMTTQRHKCNCDYCELK